MTSNRRTFLKGAFAAGAVLASAASAHAKELTPGMKWDAETDVAVIGFGGAGASAAIAAHDAGAKVMVFEKMSEGGGNTAVSGGGFIIPANASDAYEYLSKTFEFADNEMDKDLVRTFCEEASKTREYLASLDPTIELAVWGHANFPKLPHADTITKFAVRGKKTGGMNLFSKLSELVEKRGIQVFLNTPAVKLVRRGEEVVGVIVKKDGKDFSVRANKGVVLATGGYEYDEETLRNYCQATQVHGLGNPGNTGDGLRLAQSMGAKLWHMTSYSCPLGIQIPGKKSCVLINMMTPGYIWVNQDGRRFCNEAGLDFHSHFYAVNGFDPAKHRYPAIPCYLIMDEAGRKAGPITHRKFGYVSVKEGYRWSKDCEEEIKSGIVKKADTLEELAKLIKVPADELVSTVKRWNENISQGKDPEFGRLVEKPKNEKDSMVGATARKLSAPLLQGPYYAIELYPALLNTQGGPRRDGNGNVITSENKPVSRLYVAGELGSVWGTIYQGSSNVAEALVFGRIVGRNAAKEKSWS